MTTFAEKKEADPNEIEGFVVGNQGRGKIKDYLHDEHHPIYHFIAKVICR